MFEFAFKKLVQVKRASLSLAWSLLVCLPLLVLLIGNNVLAENIAAAPGEYLVKFNQKRIFEQSAKGARSNPQLLKDVQASISDTLGANVAEKLPRGLSLVKLKEGKQLNLKALQSHLESGLIDYIEPNYQFSIDAVPNDPRLDELWGMHNSGQSGGTADVDIDAAEVWDVSTGDEQIVVGVVDTGIDYNHPDLKANMWLNPGEIAGNGIDDDGNGVIDDLHGYNAINDSGDPFDDHSHGTHCAGTIAAVGNNEKGVVGVMWNAKLVALKFLSSSGSGYTSDAVKAIDYAIGLRQRGVNLRVLSNSWGGGGASQSLKDAISRANAAGILFVAAAGNSARDNDTSPTYPANYPVENVVSVAAVSRSGALAYFSNWGKSSVHLAAPGVQILSTVPNAGYSSFSGTSMATPHVAGVAALAFSQQARRSPQEMRELLKQSVKPLDSLVGKTQSEGVVSAYRALTGDFSFPPRLEDIKDFGLHREVGRKTIAIEASDPEGEPLTYTAEAEQPEKVSLSFNENFLTITPRENFLGALVIQVRVSDGTHEVSDTFTVTVHNNEAPVILPIEDKVVKTTGSLYFIPSIHDPNEDELEVSASVIPRHAGVIYANTRYVYFRPAEGYLGQLTAVIEVRDHYNLVSRSFKIDVFKNQAPKLGDIGDQVIGQNTDYLKLQLDIKDPDDLYHQSKAVVSPEDAAKAAVYGDQLYLWPETSYVGKFQVKITVSDGEASDSKRFQVLVNKNQAPLLEEISQQVMAPHTTHWFQVFAEDPEGDSLQFKAELISWRSRAEVGELPLVEAGYSGWITVTAPAGFEGIFVGRVTVSDGLAESEREFHVLVHNSANNGQDSDRDGVSDRQEEYEGTDAYDPGSFKSRRARTLCSEWNGFLGGMWNIKELVNLGYEDVAVETTLYDIQGSIQSVQSFTIAPGAQFDLLVHDMNGWRPNSYGKVCSRVIGEQGGAIDGRMVYYKEKPEGGFQFAFAMPLLNGIRGKQFVTFNTFQPSLKIQDSENLRSNWIQLSNLEKNTQRGSLIFYDMNGDELARRSLELPAGARRDFSGHQFGNNLVGLVEWAPEDEFAYFQLRNVRYYYDNAFGNESFQAAFQLESSLGSGQVLSAPINTRGASSVVEVSNTDNKAVDVTLSIYNKNGTLVSKQERSLAAHSSWHVVVDQLLPNQEGMMQVQGSEAASLIATLMQYGREQDGGIRYLYGIQAKESMGAFFQGSYNTFLGQGCELIMLNSSDSSVSAGVHLTRFDGTYIHVESEITIPPFAQTSLNVCSYDSENKYGVVSVYTPRQNSLQLTLNRIGENDSYRFPTPVRE